jgi:nucleoid-associated protein YgaU
MVGLTDEYVDSSVPDRQSESSPGAYQDHSLMGNYKTEGEDAADVRERHGEAIASDLSSETGSRFSAGMSPTYTVRPGDTLTNIALRVYGTEQRWTAVMLANASRIDDIPVDPGTRLYLP